MLHVCTGSSRFLAAARVCAITTLAIFATTSCRIVIVDFDKKLGGHRLQASAADGGKLISCDHSESITLTPIKIDGGQHLYFSTDDLAIFLNPEIQIQSVQLNVTLAGKQTGTPDEVQLSANGIQATGAHYWPHYRLLKYDDRDDSSQVRFHLHHMKLNGAEPLYFFMAKIVKNRGLLKLTLQGKKVRIAQASIEVTYASESDCNTPDPDPSPTVSPTAPQTYIDSTTPSVPITNQNSISISFSSDQTGVSFLCSLDGGQEEACSSPYSYSGLGDVTHTFHVAARNASGLTDPAGASYVWTIDTIPASTPELNAENLPPITRDTAAVFSFTSADAVSFLCASDGGAFATCTSPVSRVNLEEGLHQFAVVGIDAAGNTGEVPAVFQWAVDRTLPVTAIVQVVPSSAITSSQAMQLLFAATEGGSFECALDSGNYMPCESPFSLQRLADGQHFFQVRATDIAGNIGEPATYAWTVDTIAPEVLPGNVNPPQGPTNEATIAFNFSANEQASFNCSIDNAGFGPCTSPFTGSIFTNGPHNLAVIAMDLAGNVSSPVYVEWMMDFIDPMISFGAMAPSAASHINSSHLSAEIYSSEAVIMSCSLNDLDLQQSQSPISVSALSEGSYSLIVMGQDLAGNLSNIISHLFTVDLTPPAVSLKADISNTTTRLTMNSFAFTANEASSFTCNLDGAGFSACSSPLPFAGLAEGAHVFEVMAIDLAGNTSTHEALQWTVDLTAPVTTLNSTQTSRATVSLSIISSEANSTVACSLDGATPSVCGSSFTLSNLSVGSHSFAAWATDPAGNADLKGAVINFVIEPPVTTRLTSITPSSTLNNQGSVTFTFDSNLPTATFLCSLDNKAPVSCSSPSTYNGLSEGVHTFTVRAVDRFGGQDSVVASHRWTTDFTPPSSLLNATRTSNSAITFTFTASEAASGFQCSWDGGLFAPCASPVMSSNLALGNHSFVVQATDLAGNTDQLGPSHQWTVDPAPQTSLDASTPSTPITNSTSASFSFSSNLNTATFVCQLDESAFETCTSPMDYSDLSNGPHLFTVKAVDSFGTEDLAGVSQQWIVDSIPPVTSLNFSRTSNTAISFRFTANEEVSGFVCSFDNAPFALCSSPLNFNDLPVGEHALVVKGIDGVGNTDPEGASYHWVVDPRLSTSLILISPPSNYTNSKSAELSFAANLNGSTFTCSLDNSSFSACTSPISYSALADGLHTFTVKAVDQYGSQDLQGASQAWTVDTKTPTVLTISAPTTSTTITINWTTNEPTTGKINWGPGTTTPNSIPEDTSLVTSHSVVIKNLLPGTLYSYVISGHDQAGNAYTVSRRQVRTNY